MHTVVRSVVRPFLESAMDTTSIHDKLGTHIVPGSSPIYLLELTVLLFMLNSAGIRGLRKSLGDLELSLQHLQQDVEIPHITLVPHPLVKEVCFRLDQATCLCHSHISNHHPPTPFWTRWWTRL